MEDNSNPINSQSLQVDSNIAYNRKSNKLFSFICVMMFVASFLPGFSNYAGLPLQTVFRVSPTQINEEHNLRVAKAQALAAQDPNSLGQPLSKYGLVYPIHRSFLQSLIKAFSSQITMLFLIIIAIIIRKSYLRKKINDSNLNSSTEITGPNYWYSYITFIQIAILVPTIFFSFIFGFSWGSTNPRAFMVGPIIIIAFILVSVLSIVYFFYLFKSKFSVIKCIIFITTLIVPVLVFNFVPSSIKDLRDSKVKQSELDSANDFNRIRLLDVEAKFEKLIIIKDFGHTNAIKHAYAPFFIETSDGSVIVPLPQSGKATEDEVIAGLGEFVGKEFSVKLTTDNVSDRNPIHKNYVPFYRKDSHNINFTPTEYYFVNIFYKGKPINILDKNLLQNLD